VWVIAQKSLLVSVFDFVNFRNTAQHWCEAPPKNYVRLWAFINVISGCESLSTSFQMYCFELRSRVRRSNSHVRYHRYVTFESHSLLILFRSLTNFLTVVTSPICAKTWELQGKRQQENLSIKLIVDWWLTTDGCEVAGRWLMTGDSRTADWWLILMTGTDNWWLVTMTCCWWLMTDTDEWCWWLLNDWWRLIWNDWLTTDANGCWLMTNFDDDDLWRWLMTGDVTHDDSADDWWQIADDWWLLTEWMMDLLSQREI
jgi:hypothetical protein